MIYTGSSWLFRMGSNYAEVTKRNYQSPSHPCSKYIFWILAIPFSYIGKIIKRKCDETMMKHYPNAPYLWITYLHYVKETWPHSGDVGKFSFRGASGLSLPWIISEPFPCTGHGATGCWDRGTFPCFVGRPCCGQHGHDLLLKRWKKLKYTELKGEKNKNGKECNENNPLIWPGFRFSMLNDFELKVSALVAPHGTLKLSSPVSDTLVRHDFWISRLMWNSKFRFTWWG